MNSNLRTDTCDPDRLESFLNGDLSDAQERDFTSHLNTCESCRRSLEHLAAEPESWTEAERLLKPSHFDSLGTEAVSGFAVVDVPSRQTLPIQNVLDALGPTDDPEMLGRLGGYEVSGVVGAGGMGVVLKAIDKSLDRTVAIKVLAPHLATSGAARKRFAREAKAAAAVLHPNVIAIHSVSNDELLPYLVMPYVRGTSLQKRLDLEGPLPLNEILRIGSQIAAGLAAAHAQGLVHRDIKPANILLEEGVERVTITDFGLARAVDDATITHSGVIAGTPQYMSPEQARGEVVEQRSDLFSLGSVLYAISTGRPPFRAETTYGVMRRITDDEPTAIREINPDIPDWLCAIVARLMSKRASDRYESAAEVTELLEACLAHVQQPAAVPLPASLVPPVAARRWISTARRKGVIAMLGALGLALVGMVCWQASEAPDIAGQWSGDDWGQVVLKKIDDAEYTGTYSDTFGKQPGEIQLKWSRIERRFNGAWREGEDRFGDISVRLVGDEIRGALTTDAKSKINPATPRLADLLWKRSGDNGNAESGEPPPPAKIRWEVLFSRPPKPTTDTPPRPLRLATGMTVKVIAYSADGKLIGIANDRASFIVQKDGKSVDNWAPSAEIIDAETGKIIVSLKLNINYEDTTVLAEPDRVYSVDVTSLKFSPDGSVLAAGTNLGQVKLFNARTGKLIRALDDRKGRVADKNTREKLKSFSRAMGSVASLAFSPDGSLLAVCGGSFDDDVSLDDKIRQLGESTTGPGRLKVWDVKTGALKFDLAGHDNQANAVAFSPDGNLLASAGNWRDASEAGTGAIIWDALNGTQVCRIRVEANGGTHSVAFSPNSKLVAIGSVTFDKDKANDSATGVVRLAHAATGIVDWQQTVPGWLGPVAFTPDGKSVAVLSAGRSIRFLDAETGKEKNSFQSADYADERWNDFAIAANGHMLAVGGIDAEANRRGFVEFWTLDGGSAESEKTSGSNSSQSPAATNATPRFVHQFATDMTVKTIAYSADGKRIAIANDSPSILAHEDGSFSVVGNTKPEVEIIDAETGNCIISLPLTTSTEEKRLFATERVPPFHVKALAFSPDGTVLAIGTSIGQVKLFNARTGEIHSLDDNREKVADKKSPEKLKSLARAMGSVASLAFSPDGNMLAVCGDSFDDVPLVPDKIDRLRLATGPGRLKVWDVKTGTLKFDLVGHDNQAYAVAFSPDGNLLASAGNWRDTNEVGTAFASPRVPVSTGVIIWDALNGTQICRIRVAANGGTHFVAFSPNSKLVAIGSVTFATDKATDAVTGIIGVAHPATGITEWTQTVPGYNGPVAFTPDGKSVAVLRGGKSIQFLDTESGKEKNAFQSADSAHREGWNDFAIAPNGHMLAIGGIDAQKHGFVEVWNLDGGPTVGEHTSEVNSPQPAASVSRTFPLRFKLASEMANDLRQILLGHPGNEANDLRQILLGRPGNEAKPSENNMEITVIAPPEVMNRARTFITVMDWPDGITRRPNFEYPRDSVMHAARSFFYACAIEDADEVFSKLLSLQVLAELGGVTKSAQYHNYIIGGTPDAEWEKSLRADWPGKKEAIRRLVREWNRYPLKRITERDGVAIGFGVKNFCSVSFAGAPKDFYDITIEPNRAEHGTGNNSYFFSSLPPWWPKADVPATDTAPQESESSQETQPERKSR